MIEEVYTLIDRGWLWVTWWTCPVNWVWEAARDHEWIRIGAGPLGVAIRWRR